MTWRKYKLASIGNAAWMLGIVILTLAGIAFVFYKGAQILMANFFEVVVTVAAILGIFIAIYLLGRLGLYIGFWLDMADKEDHLTFDAMMEHKHGGED